MNKKFQPYYPIVRFTVFLPLLLCLGLLLPILTTPDNIIPKIILWIVGLGFSAVGVIVSATMLHERISRHTKLIYSSTYVGMYNNSEVPDRALIEMLESFKPFEDIISALASIFTDGKKTSLPYTSEKDCIFLTFEDYGKILVNGRVVFGKSQGNKAWVTASIDRPRLLVYHEIGHIVLDRIGIPAVEHHEIMRKYGF